MVRISDSRMSGTSYGTVILHVTPEAAARGPLAIVRTGDRISLNVPQRKLDLLLPEEIYHRLNDLELPTNDTAERLSTPLYRSCYLQAESGDTTSISSAPKTPRN